MSELKPTNPKDIVGVSKIPMHLNPAPALAEMALGLLDGMLKYGRANWTAAGIRYTIYLDAIVRHAEAIKAGEDLDPDSGLPHRCHILATVAIIADAAARGVLIDDRAPRFPGFRSWLNELTLHVERLKKKHEGKDPHHYTIGDELPRMIEVSDAHPENEPYEGVTREEGRLGCSFLQGLNVFGARK